MTTRVSMILLLGVAWGLIMAGAVATDVAATQGEKTRATSWSDRVTRVAPHRALYSLSLHRTTRSSSILSATGAMMISWGDTCDGWTIEQRYRVVLYRPDGNTDFATSLIAWESKDGQRYRFFNRRGLVDDIPTEHQGEAVMDGNHRGGTVTFDTRPPKSFSLPSKTVFPSLHTILIINAARNGVKMFGRPVFDGGDIAPPLLATAVIGNVLPVDEPPEHGLLRERSWPVRIAFFKTEDVSGLPESELGVRLYENGVATDFNFDFGDYVLRADLERLERLDRPDC